MPQKKGEADNTHLRSANAMENLSITLQSVNAVRTLHHTIVLLRNALEDAKFEIKQLRSQLSIQKEASSKHGADLSQIRWKQRLSYIAGKGDQSETIDEKRFSQPEECKISYVPYIAPNMSRKASSLPKEEINTITEKEGNFIDHYFEDDSDDPRKIDKKVKTDVEIFDTAKSADCHELELHQNINLPDETTCVDLYTRNSEFKKCVKLIPDIKLNTSNISSKIDINIIVQSNFKDQYLRDIIPKAPHSSDNTQKQEKYSNVELGGNHGLCLDGAKLEKSKTGKLPDKNHIPSNSGLTFSDGKPLPLVSNPEARSSILAHDSKENVDDIELIISSGENRDNFQEDLVSISDYELLQLPGEMSTPVLVKIFSPQFDEDAKSFEKKITAEMSQHINEKLSLPQQQQKSPANENDLMSLMLKKNEERKIPLERKPSYLVRKMLNYNAAFEYDISKCGLLEETTFEMQRRNTCPNPSLYKTLAQRRPGQTTCHLSDEELMHSGCTVKENATTTMKMNSAAQAEIGALLEHWKSESHLSDIQFSPPGKFTLPSKFTPNTNSNQSHKNSIRKHDRTHDAKRILLSDINFTSMVPELSRSADHLHQGGTQNALKLPARYYKDIYLKASEYSVKDMAYPENKTSPGNSKWTVNEKSLRTQTIQPAESWAKRDISFHSCRSYSVDSRFNRIGRAGLSGRSQSARCAACKLCYGIRTSEIMNYTPRETFQGTTTWR